MQIANRTLRLLRVASLLLALPPVASSEVLLSVGDTSVLEGNPGDTVTLDFPVTITGGPTTADVTVNYSAGGPGTATGNSDYSTPAGGSSETFPAGTSSGIISIDIFVDSEIEPDETFTLTLSNPVNTDIADGTATGTILNDDQVSLSVGDASVLEGNPGDTVTLDFPVTITGGPTTADVTVNYSAGGPGTATGNSDYSTPAGGSSETFPAGTSSGIISIDIFVDSEIEPDETFTLTLSNPVNTDIADGTATGTILNDDQVSLSVGDASVLEGNPGDTVTLDFPVTITGGPTTADVTVEYRTIFTGSAGENADFVAIISSETFPAGTSSGVISIGIIEDSEIEPDETFDISLSNPVNTDIADGTATGTILNDDQHVTGGADFISLPLLPGGTFSIALDISADGSVVVGEVETGTGEFEAVRWIPATGDIFFLGDLPGGATQSGASTVSGDGLVLVGDGRTATNPRPFRWTNQDGMVELGALPGGNGDARGRGVDADGNVVVGYSSSADSSFPGCQIACRSEAYRWESGVGMSGLGDLPGGIFSSIAQDVSRDGAVVVGAGNHNDVTDEAFRWTVTGGMEGLGSLVEDGFSHALGISGDGLVIVGDTDSPNGREAFSWTESEGMVGLGDLPGGAFFSRAYAASVDGSVITGDSETAAGREAVIWDQINGMRNLKDVLEDDCGLDLTGWTLWSALVGGGPKGISDDGLVIAGTGINPLGQTQGWVATLCSASPTPVPSLPNWFRIGLAMLLACAAALALSTRKMAS